MTADEYQALCTRTESDPETARLRITGLYGSDHQSVLGPVRLLHALLGMLTETGEVATMLKKHFFYGTTLDHADLDEEVGDLLWYVALYCNAAGVKMGDLMAANVRKLRARFPDKFTEEQALNRDLGQEQKALKSSDWKYEGAARVDGILYGNNPLSEPLQEVGPDDPRRDHDRPDGSDLDRGEYGGGVQLDHGHDRLSDDGNPHHQEPEVPRCDRCGGKMAGWACPHCDCEYA